MDQRLNYQQTADFLGIPVGTLYCLVFRRQIPHIRISKRIVRFSKMEIEAWLAMNSVQLASTKGAR